MLHSATFLRSALLLLLCYATVTHAFSFISVQENVFEEGIGADNNITRFKTRTGSFVCTDTDFRAILQIGKRWVDILCSPPLYTFRVVLRLFVPHQRRRHVIEVCLLNSASDQVDSFATERGGSAARRRLLAFLETQSVRDRGQKKPYVHNRQMLSFFDDVKTFFDPSSPKSLWCMAATGAFTPNDCLPKPDPTLTNAQINALLADIRFKDELAKWLNVSREYVDVQVKQFNQQVLNVADAFNHTTTLLAKQQATLFDGLTALTFNVDADRNRTRQELDLMLASIDAGVNVSEAIAERARQFENATNTNFRRLFNTTKSLAEAIAYHARKSVRNYRDIFRYVRQLAAEVFRAFMKPQLRRILSTMIHASIAEQEATGDWKAFLDPAFRGYPPGPTTPEIRTSLVDRFYVNFINTTDGLHPLGAGVDRMHNYIISYYCNSKVILDNTIRDIQWTDFLELMTPKNCTNSTGATVDNCRCWVEVTHTECTPTVGYSWSHEPIVGNPNLQIIALDNSDIRCDVATRPSTSAPKSGQYGYPGYGLAWNNRKISDLDSWHGLLGSLCSTVGSLNSPSDRRLLYVTSFRLGRHDFETSDVSFSDKARVCRPDLDYVFDDDPQNNNFMYSIYKFLALGYSTLVNEKQPVERQTWGILPRHITYDTVPFEYTSNNDTYECVRGSYTVVSYDTRPGYTIEPTGESMTITVTAYDTAPVCGEFGCTFGPPVSVDITRNIVPTVIFDGLLPKPSYTLVGELWTTTTPAQTTLFDVPENAAPMTTALMARKNTVTNNWQPVPSGYNLTNSTNRLVNTPISLGGPYPDTTLLDEWLANNADTYDTGEALYTLDVHEVPLAGGKCVYSTDIPPGWLCTMLEHFSIHPSTDFRKLTQWVIQARDAWFGIGTIGIDEGPIVQTVFSGCPQFRTRPNTKGIRTLVLYNPYFNPIRALVRKTSLTSGCVQDGDVVYRIDGRTEVEDNIIPCGDQRLSVFQYVPAPGGVGEVEEQCEFSVNITFDPTNPTNTRQYIVSTTNRSMVADEALVQLATFEQTWLVTLNNILARIPAATIVPGMVTLAEDTTVQESINQYKALINATKSVAQSSTVESASAAIKPAVDQFIATAGQLQLALAAQGADITQLKSAQATLLGIVARLDNQTIATINATLDSIKADQALIVALQNQYNSVQKSSKDCTWCYDDWHLGDIPILGDIICFFFCAIANFFKNVLVFILIGLAIYCCAPSLIQLALRALKSGMDNLGDAGAPPPAQVYQQQPPPPQQRSGGYQQLPQQEPVIPMNYTAPASLQQQQKDYMNVMAARQQQQQVQMAIMGQQQQQLPLPVGGGGPGGGPGPGAIPTSGAGQVQPTGPAMPVGGRVSDSSDQKDSSSNARSYSIRGRGRGRGTRVVVRSSERE